MEGKLIFNWMRGALTTIIVIQAVSYSWLSRNEIMLYGESLLAALPERYPDTKSAEHYWYPTKFQTIAGTTSESRAGITLNSTTIPWE